MVPSGLSLSGPDMSLDMRLLIVSVEIENSEGSDSMAVGLIDPMPEGGTTDPAKTAAYTTLHSGDTTFWLQATACSPRDCQYTRRQRRGPIAMRWAPV